MKSNVLWGCAMVCAETRDRACFRSLGLGTRRLFGSLTAGAVVLLAMSVAPNAPAQAQEPTAEAYLDPPEVAIGEQFRLVVEVKGARTVEGVVIPEFFDFAYCVNPYDPDVHVTVGDAQVGFEANTVALSYVFVASQAGFFEMRPFRVTADGRTLETEALAVLVGGSHVRIEARVEPSEVNVGGEFELLAEVFGLESEFPEFTAPDLFDVAEQGSFCHGSGRAFRCTIQARAPGEFTIPPVRVVDRGTTYESNPVTLVVTDEPRPVEVQATLGSRSIWVGGEFTFRLDVAGTHELDEEPAVPDMGDFAEFLGLDEPRTWWGNGEEEIAYSYRFRAIRPGRFEIAPMRIVADGSAFETDAVSLVVDPVPTGDTVPPDHLFLTTAAAKSRASVGEPVIVTYTVAHDEHHGWPRIGTKSWPSFDDFDVVQHLGYRRQEGTNTSVRAQVGRITADRLALFPLRPGQFNAGTATMEARVEKPWDMWAGLNELEPELVSYVLTSDPFTIEVLPLPESGRPDSFRGHVGTLKATCRLNGTRIGVGEKVTLEVRVAVDGYVEGLRDPEIEFPSGFAVAEPEIDMVLAEYNYKLQGTRTYTYHLTATTPGTYVIPAIEMSYFDPETESYGTTRSHPFTVTVVPAGAEAR